MDRRKFIGTLARAAGVSALSGVSGPLLAQSAYTGKFLISVQLDGGVDVTSFCDPKINVPGEPEISRWARSADIVQAGNIPYAPYAANASFFDKYYSDLLVINGIDAQTNAHSVGVVSNWSGRNSEGFPTITSLMAANYAPELPLSYLNFGGYGATQGIIRSTRIDDVKVLNNIIFPNKEIGSSVTHLPQSEWESIQALQAQNLQNLNLEQGIPAGNRKNRQYYLEAFTRAEGIQAFGNLIPDQDQIQQARFIFLNVPRSTIHQQMQITLLAFKAGVSIAADLFEGGYDTHSNHEEVHIPLLENLADALDYLWITAEELGLADRLVVLIGSDFGRTPYFNSSQGKDHWPIGSYMVMEKNVGYTNRVVGETDGGHNAYKISSNTLQRDDANGSILYPKHLHKALRRYLGIEDSPITKLFPFNNTEHYDFFG